MFPLSRPSIPIQWLMASTRPISPPPLGVRLQSREHDVAGRPPLRIGQHGKIARKALGGGVWLARCRFRDLDGVTRVVERRSPAGQLDQHGKFAEDVLVEALKTRRPPGVSGEISLDTRICDLVDRHLDMLAEMASRLRP